MVLVAFDLDDLAFIVGVDLEAASCRMAAGGRPGGQAGDREVALLESPGFAEVVHIGQRVKLDGRRCLHLDH